MNGELDARPVEYRIAWSLVWRGAVCTLPLVIPFLLLRDAVIAGAPEDLRWAASMVTDIRFGYFFWQVVLIGPLCTMWLLRSQPVHYAAAFLRGGQPGTHTRASYQEAFLLSFSAQWMMQSLFAAENILAGFALPFVVYFGGFPESYIFTANPMYRLFSFGLTYFGVFVLLPFNVRFAMKHPFGEVAWVVVRDGKREETAPALEGS